MSAVDMIAAGLLLAGVVLITLACIGLQRFDDVFARLHAASKAPTLGVVLVGVAAALRAVDGEVAVKLLLALMLQVVTAPIAAHAIARAAHRTGTELSPRATVDELQRDNESASRAP